MIIKIYNVYQLSTPEGGGRGGHGSPVDSSVKPISITTGPPDFRAVHHLCIGYFKVHIFLEGHKILQNLHLTFDWHYIGQK